MIKQKKKCIKKANPRNVEYANPMSDAQMKQWNIDHPVELTTPRTVEEKMQNG